MKFAAFLLLAAFAEPNTASQDGGAKDESKKERLICKRDMASESRLGSKRICKTARQWKESQDGEGADVRRPVRGS